MVDFTPTHDTLNLKTDWCSAYLYVKTYRSKLLGKNNVGKQGRSQDFGWGEHQTKFPVRFKEFRFEAVNFSKNLLNEDF